MGADTRVGVHRARPYRISPEVHRRYEASVPLAITSPTTNGLGHHTAAMANSRVFSPLYPKYSR